MRLYLKNSVCAFLISIGFSTVSFADEVVSLESDPIIAIVKHHEILESDFGPFVDAYFNNETELSELKAQDLMFLLYHYYGQKVLANLAKEKGLGESAKDQEKYQLMVDSELAKEVQINEEILDSLEGIEYNPDQKVAPELLVSLKEIFNQRMLDEDKEALAEEEIEYLTLEYLKLAELVKIAKEQELDQQEMFVNRMNFHRQQYLAELFKKDFENDQSFTDDELETNYQKWLATQDYYYYKLAHIYVEEEALAQELLEKILNQEISFEAAAEQYTLDISTKGHGGKVAQGSWVQLSPDHPFTLAVKALEVGEMSSEVSRGLNGFHIIRFDDVKEELPSAERHHREFKKRLAIDAAFAEFLESIVAPQDIVLEQTAKTVD